MKGKAYILFVVLLLLDSCINRVDLDAELVNNSDFVVDGFISNKKGPYQVRLYIPSNAEDNVLFPEPIAAREVSIHADDGSSEVLAGIGSGVYQTKPDGIRGEIGKKYKIKIELLDGSIFESTPEEVLPVDSIDQLSYTFQSFKPLQGPTQYGFKVFMDTKNRYGPVRWRFTGTYVVETFPQFRLSPRVCRMGIPDPPPCSGYRRTASNTIENFASCTCCICWVSENEPKPYLSDEVIASDGTFKNIDVGYIPFDVWRFHYQRYMVKVEQMSLTTEARAFWKIIQDQKQGSGSLFQPSLGTITTNLVSLNSRRRAFGFFYATAISEKVIFIHASDAAIPVPDFDRPGEEVCPQFWNECDVAWLNASRTQPPEWED
ncbi:MAG: DUF4249 family protein [Cyclobacteriaceae bacterium]